MSIQQLVQLLYQCKIVLGQIPPSSKIVSLIQRINLQLAQYSQFKIDNHSIDKNRRSQSRTKSKRKIFEVVSKEGSPVKKSNIIKFPKSQILSSPADNLIEQLSISNSQISQISLTSVRLSVNSKSEDSFEDLSHSTSMVNNSFDNNHHRILFSNEICPENKSDMIKEERQMQVEIEDFFIIDYNFQKKEYEILPKKQNFNGKCNILNELQSQYNNNNNQQYSKLIMLKKNSSVGQKQAINPFQQIMSNNRSSMTNESQLSMDSILPINRYSMEAQVDSSKSRMINLGIERDEKQIDELYQIREVIMNLVLDSTPGNHIKQIKATSSMTDLLKLTTNPSSKNKTLEHIIIPSCLQIRTYENTQNCNKYTHVIKTHQGISFGLRYFECERFFVIVEKKKNFLHVQNIIQALIKKAYEIRVKRDREVDNVFYNNIRKYIEQISLIPKQRLISLIKVKSNEFLTDSTYTNARMPTTDPLYQVSLYCQAAINLQFTLELSTSYSSKGFHLVLILLYFVIFEYKIIFLTTKGYENIVSEVVNTLIHMMGDLRYIYPIIMAVLTNHHIEFVHAPVPGILALWGKESRCKKAIQFMKRKLKDQAQQYMTSSSNSQSSNSLLTVVIDMNKHEFIDHSFSHKELFLIENLQNFVRRPSKHTNFFDKMNYLFNEFLLNDNLRDSDYKEKWIQMLRQRLRNTQMYEEYMKYQQTLRKQKFSRRN